MSKYSLFSVERHQLESDACAGFAHFLRVKTAGWQRQLVHDPLDQRRLPATGTTREQNFRRHTRA
jgi:hypothetical protein